MLLEMKNGKKYVGFLIHKLYQILKQFVGKILWAQTFYFWRVTANEMLYVY